MNPLVLSEQERRLPARMPSRPRPDLLLDMLWSGVLGSFASALAAGGSARAEGRGALQPLNATSHWLHGERAGRVRRLDVAHTGVGLVTHIASALFWAVPYSLWLQRKSERYCRRDYRRRRGDRGDGGNGRLSRHAPAADAWMGTGAQQTQHRHHLRRLGAGSRRWRVARAVPSRRVEPSYIQGLVGRTSVRSGLHVPSDASLPIGFEP